MNLGDGLLFEFENGKPKLIVLSHGVEKNPAKLLFRPRAANNILSSRQLSSCLEEVQGVERPTQQQLGRCKEARSKTVGTAASSLSNTSTTNERSTPLTSSKTHGHHNGAGIKAVTKVNSHRHKQGSTVGSLRASGKTAKPQNGGARAGGKGHKDKLAGGDAGQKDSVVVLTNEQLQQILNTVQTSSTGQPPPEEHNMQGSGSGDRKQCSQSGTSLNEGGGGGGGEMKEEDRGGGKVLNRLEGDGGVINTTGTSQDKDNRLSGCFFSWLEGRQSDSRLATDTKKAQWRRELDEQVALKQQQQQQRFIPDRPQTGEDRESVLSHHSSTKHREQPAAIRSSLKLGDITPVEEVMSVDRREEQRRCWLEELDRQREETAERRRREKLLQSQTEDHDLWTTHFDSLQRRPPVHTTAPPSAPPPAPSIGSERGEWEPSSSLSLVWDATSSCGAESVDLTNRFPSRASYLRTMTALLDPAQIEERERKRLKQLEQQRAIEAQVEERRQQREREQMRRREEEDRDARRVAAEREMLQRQYKLESQKVRDTEPPSQQAEEPKKVHNQMLEPNIPSHLEQSVSSSLPPYRDTAVQTDAPSVPVTDAQRVQTPDVSAQYQAPVTPPNSRNPAVRTGKENICLPEEGGGGGDPYEAFARTERNKRDKRRPEWNTQKPSRRFVPASERYPAALQRNRQESRLKRQAELLALQERTCLSRTEPPPQHQDPRLCSNFTKAGAGLNKEETVSRGQNISTVINNERHRMQSRQAPNPLPPLVQEFVPYIRTDEIILDPLESADNPPPHTYTDAAPLSSASPPASSHRGSLLQPEQLCKTHTQRQQEILRGLAQLRQGLLQKQRELETDLNPLLKRHDNKL
uniref:coiled-coil domain-containing protein 66 isoform X2 n=1 Tax=Solea senegalensis TaxID=28829 RepID=UPI001CD8D676|nr:coiled-coil domain-containing protein 66 isoform X2 [Solea senegalensis]